MRGSCLCGRVAFELSGPRPKLYQCHCSLCRKQGGSASNTSAVVEAAHFRWLSGEDAIAAWQKATGFRSHFCSVCGSTLPNPTRGGRGWWVPAGLLDDDVPLEIVAQVHVASKAPWDTVLGPGARFDTRPAAAELQALMRPDTVPTPDRHDAPATAGERPGAVVAAEDSDTSMQPSVTLLTLGVADLERAVGFYRDGLGWPTKGIVGAGIEYGAVAFFELRSGLKLALWPRRSIAADTGLPEGGPAPTAFTLGHNVGSEREVDAVMRRAERAGARIVKAALPTAWGGYAGYFQDPDEHLWEIAFNPGFASL